LQTERGRSVLISHKGTDGVMFAEQIFFVPEVFPPIPLQDVYILARFALTAFILIS
jgi:hypothetical protein